MKRTESGISSRRSDALRIARENDFETGTEPWTASFHHVYGTQQRFVWDVSTALSDDPSGESKGRTLTIDASSGAVISVGDWFASSCRFDRL